MSTSPATEAVFTMCPSCPSASIRGTKERTPCTTPMRLMSSVHFQSSIVAVQMGPATATPALLKTRWTAPNFSQALAASASRSPGFETSQRMHSARTPICAIAISVSRMPFSSMSASTTFAPSRAQAITSSRPMPLPAPVTTAVLPFRSRIASPSCFPLDRIPTGVRFEPQPVLLLQFLHEPQPFLLAARADRGDGTTAMGGEAGAEDDARVAEIRVRDDPFAHAGDRFVQRRQHHAVGERLQVHGARADGTLLGLAPGPRVEALAALLSEFLRLDERLELLRDRRARLRELLSHGPADVEAHHVGKLDRSHGHAEVLRGR